MKTRVHIHREDIAATANRKHFIVTIPRDAGEVIGIKISCFGIKASPSYGSGGDGIGGGDPSVGGVGDVHDLPSAGNFERGLLRITRDGVILYETQVREEIIDAHFTQLIPSISPIESGIVFQSGGKNLFHSVRFTGEPRALFCRYDANNAPSSDSYKFVLYFLYSKKNKQ